MTESQAFIASKPLSTKASTERLANLDSNTTYSTEGELLISPSNKHINQNKKSNSNFFEIENTENLNSQNSNLQNSQNPQKTEICLKDYKKAFNILSFFFLSLATLNYLVSLKGCELPIAQCMGQLTRRMVFYFVGLVSSSAFFYSLNFMFTLYKFNSPLYALFQLLLIAYITLIHDTEYTLKNHGGYNRLFFAIIFCVFFFAQNILFVLIYLLRRKFVPVLIIILIVFSSGITYMHRSLQRHCSTWDSGLSNSKFDNSGSVCKIKFPKFCWMNMLNGYFDISYVFIQDCSVLRMDSKEQLSKYLKNPKAQVLGFPRTEGKKYFPDSQLEEFQFRVLSEMIDMEDPQVSKDVKDKVEAVIDFREKQPQIKIRIADEPKLREERRNVYERNKEKLMVKNVIHFFIDSLSRDNFKRALPKTKRFFEKYFVNSRKIKGNNGSENEIDRLSKNENFKNENNYDINNEYNKNENNKEDMQAEVFQFFKFHGVTHFTYGNMIPIQFGRDFQQPDEETNPAVFYLKYFKDAGFITGQGHGYCGREIYDLEKDQNQMLYTNFDHEINSIFCDPNFAVPGNPFGIFNGVFSYKRRCLYGKDTHEYVFDYAKKFWTNYENDAKFIRIAFQDAHEGTGEVVKYMDEKIVDFFEFLESTKALEDTVIILHADHGLNMPGFYTLIDAEDFFIEKTLPALFLFAPKPLASRYRETLKKKENMFLTPYDLHNTFLHLAQAPRDKFNKLGGSLFEEINEEGRNCAMFKVRDPHCNCVGEGNSKSLD